MDKARFADVERPDMPQATDAGAPAPNVSSATLIFRDILEGLYEGRFVPGQRLVEADLTRAYGVSRGSVREALSRLAAEGIVELNLHRGAQIRMMTRAEALNFITLLELLIGLAARLAAQKLKGAAKTSPERKKFQAVCRHLLGFEKKPESYELIRARNRFYQCLVEIGGNDALGRMLPLMSVHLLRVQFRAFLDVSNTDRFAGYRQISEAVLAGDARRAELAGRRHQRRVGNMLKDLPDSAFARTP
jgi:DNA-binding GntR family transcriptional regulator